MTDGPYSGSSRRPPRVPRARQSRNVFPTSAEIFDRAYQLFLANGMRSEQVADYWRRAEDELLDQAAQRALR
jgi:hypothetical protein